MGQLPYLHHFLLLQQTFVMVAYPGWLVAEEAANTPATVLYRAFALA